MASEQAKRDQNRITTIQGVTDDSNEHTRNVKIDPTTDRVKVNTTITGDTTPSDTPYNGQKTVTSAGTAEALASTTSVKSVTIQALRSNTGNIYVGDSGVDSTNGFVLSPGGAVATEIDDLATIYIDADTNGEGVCYLAVGA